MANHTYSKGLLYKKTLNSSGEVTGSVPLLLKTLGSLVIMSDGTDAETAISTAISNMVTPDETTIVTGQDGITISVKKSTSAEIDEILGDVPTSHTWEGYYTKSEVNTLVGAVDAKFNQNDIETALGYTPIASSTKGSANGVASLDANGLVPSAQLPSYVDDVIESATFAALPATGETGKIYVTLNDNKTYRWSGSAYVEISQSLALGETSSTAFAGDKGKIAYDHVSDTTKHIPTGGTNAQYLKNTGNNTYAWASPDSSWPATPTNNTIPGNKLVDDRFKANETNILYSLQTGVKNILDFASLEYADGHGAPAVTKTDTTITIASGIAWARAVYSGIHLTAGTYVLSVNITSATFATGSFGTIRIVDNAQATGGIAQLDINSVGKTFCIFVVDTESDLYFSFSPNYGGDVSTANSFTATDVMICTKAAWDQESNVYRPFAAPNYDLTQLEQQDRNALVEQVDEGAKNLLEIPTSQTVRNSTFTKDADDWVTSDASTDYTAWTVANSNVSLNLKAGTYIVVAISHANNTATCEFSIMDSNSTEITRGGINYGQQETYTVKEFTINSAMTVYIMYKLTTQKCRFMICTKAKYNISPNYEPYALPNTDLTRMVNDLQKKAVKVYTYHVNPNESDPEDAVTYLDDATGLTPAKMGASSFSYGSWANAWFLPRPCMLKSDGTVAYYLNPNDYSKKTDGTVSDIADANFDGNVMLEFPKIWVKRVNDGNGARTVSIAPVNVDGTYKCWSNINAEDKEVDHFYLPAYNGTIHSSKMRSLSGVTLDTTYAPNYTRAQEVTAATANNPSGKNLWYTETWADMCLIFDLLYLMGKSLNLQGTFGNGLATGSETAMRAYVTGSLNDKGLFYGDISAQATGVKVLGMENLWGCRWHGVAGLINDNGALKVKMTYGVADGSTAVGYNTTGSGYLNYGSTYGTTGYVKKMQADNTMGYKIIETAGSDATYYCNYYYTNNSQLNYALMGGCADSGLSCGFYVLVNPAPGAAYWNIGAALSCRP